VGREPDTAPLLDLVRRFLRDGSHARRLRRELRALGNPTRVVDLLEAERPRWAALGKLLAHERGEVRLAAAALFLVVLPPTGEHFLHARVRGVDRALARALGDASPAVRRVALTLISHATRGVSARLLDALDDRDPEARRAALDAVARLRPRGAIARLRPLLQDEQPAVRRAAASALGRLGARTAVPRLIAMTRDRDAGCASAAISALGAIGDARAFDALRARIGRGREGAALALGMLGDPRALDVLTRLARDEGSSAKLQREAVAGLMHLADPRSRALLISLIDDPQRVRFVRMQAARALARIDDAPSREFLRECLAEGGERGYDVARGLSTYGGEWSAEANDVVSRYEGWDAD